MQGARRRNRGGVHPVSSSPAYAGSTWVPGRRSVHPASKPCVRREHTESQTLACCPNLQALRTQGTRDPTGRPHRISPSSPAYAGSTRASRAAVIRSPSSPAYAGITTVRVSWLGLVFLQALPVQGTCLEEHWRHSLHPSSPAYAGSTTSSSAEQTASSFKPCVRREHL